MKETKVTVIITCYNLEKDIERCIASLTSQTHKNLEIIVIDDGSKDNSFSVIQTIAEKDARIIPVSQANSGPSAARNHGIDLATGEFLLFIDGDDYVSDTYVEHFVEASEGCDLVIGGLRYVYPNGSETVVCEDSFRCALPEYVQQHYTGSIIKRTVFGPVNKLYRTAVIQNNNVRYREELQIREDGIFVLNMLKHCSVVCGIPHAEYYYIQNAPNASLVSKFHPNEKEINKLFFDVVVDIIGKENLKEDDIRLLYPMFLNMDIASVRKLYYSKEYSLGKGIRYIRDILRDEAFRQARAELNQVDKKLARKYYRPLLVVHLINYLSVKLKR